MDKNIQRAAHILKFLHYIRFARDIAVSFRLDYPDSIFSPSLKKGIDKIDWVFREFVTDHRIATLFPTVIDMLKEKWESDQSAELAVTEQIALLNEEQLNTLDELLETIISGKNFTIQIID